MCENYCDTNFIANVYVRASFLLHVKMDEINEGNIYFHKMKKTIEKEKQILNIFLKGKRLK